ncbi:MAG: dTDP-4-dehydrorhamnose 3,5-epimerase family protein [candidate division WOR-3 bacterium]
MREFKIGPIADVVITDLKKNSDERGWLTELFRQDEMEEGIYPVMSYVSLTYPKKSRGPHEHKEQTDYFCFLGIGTFRLYLWDNRPHSPTYQNRLVLTFGEGELKRVIVPPGVVHGYVNIGDSPAYIINFPNRLYKGWRRKEAVDEIRYENQPSPFQFDL